VTAIDLFLYFGAESLGAIEWGKDARPVAVRPHPAGGTFTLLIGLMGFVRAGIRETWHVYGVGTMRDLSDTAFTPTMGYASFVIASCTLVFLFLCVAIFRFGMRPAAEERPA